MRAKPSSNRKSIESIAIGGTLYNLCMIMHYYAFYTVTF